MATEDNLITSETCKRCPKCEQFKLLSAFNKCKTGKFGVHGHCRSCAKKLKQEWNKKNKQHILDYTKQYNQSDEVKAATKKSAAIRYANNKEMINWQNNTRRRSPEALAAARKQRNKWYEKPENKIAHNARARIRLALKGRDKSASTMELVGCTFEFLKKHIESLFLSGMTWENHAFRGWHVDHIIPCDSFDLADPEQQKKCFHFSNLQPMWWRDNISKGNRTLTITD
jgi:hypothetical protein